MAKFIKAGTTLVNLEHIVIASLDKDAVRLTMVDGELYNYFLSSPEGKAIADYFTNPDNVTNLLEGNS